ncbi:MAG TPA: N-acetyltransferase family protein [Candidatus Competibacteraceae bacterium]|nr:MAG: N-acetyltransferase family protein [Candidatus Competibacteraceae bacterium]HQA27339.1 N-acetyltransferase family protein [Candidatus Competibacteraceae bacterium]
MEVRPCESRDIEAICDIYNYYIENTVITFDETPLQVFEMAERIRSYTRLYPWLVCSEGREIMGYAYASKWKERTAYRNSAEITVYLRQGQSRKGYGRALYEVLLPRLVETGCHVVLSCIALPNEASVGLHERFGFKKVAHFTEVGRKFERWVDVGYWQLLVNQK